tara:strand:+ start:9903 stop:11126 length:1224 start_codon:yes stop_codon:yes gene_type:complete
METMSEAKDKIQRQGLNKWWGKPWYGRGTLQYATGTGKTRCGVLAAAYIAKLTNMEARILILTPTETIRDRSWKDEFYKWGYKDVFEQCVKCVCIQTAYKWIGHTFNLVIADEVHNYMSPEYFNFFSNNKYEKILGLTAYIDKIRLRLLSSIAPVIERVSTTDAQQLGLISPFKIYNVPVELTPSELHEYNKADKTFNRLFPYFNRDLNIMYRCMNKASYTHFLTYEKGEVLDDNNASYPFICNAAMAKRKNILYNSESKLTVVKQLSNMNLERKAIIFSQTIDFADKVTSSLKNCVSFHSKISKKKRTENLNLLKSGKSITRISAAKALNEGMDIPDISMAIIASGTSKTKDMIQRIGRAVRWEEGKQAVIFRIYIKDSQEEKWVASSQEDYNVELFNINEYENNS